MRQAKALKKNPKKYHHGDLKSALVAAGIPNLKLYFMVGLPTETDDDVEAIVSLCKRVKHRFLASSRTRGRIGEIGDGITVLAQPNEFGKSTFFDALHALFFEAHGGRAKTVTALQPHAGGAPEVVVELDSAGRRFRVSKRWLSRPRAVVEDATGAVVAQARDHVEAHASAPPP